MKIIFVTGGIISGLGKGVTASSIGRLFKSSGYSVTMMKIDPYLQVDAGTMSPLIHGEVYVTEDGAETDLDLGNYERFVDINLDKYSNVTTGKVYLTVIEKERRGEYLGKDVQVIPHITDEIKRRIKLQAEKAEICIVEIGGLVGDAESPVFIEAIRQMKKDVGKENVCYVHVVPLLYIEVAKEFKTKAIQLSTRQLREAGIQPHILVARCPRKMPEELRPKISLYTDVEEDCIIEAPDAKTIYEVPMNFNRQGLKEKIEDILELPHRPIDLTEWEQFVGNILHPEKEVHISIVGKYTDFEDAYMSVREALIHAGAHYAVKVQRHWISSEDIEADPLLLQRLHDEGKMDGMIVPGGFGTRGMEGKILAVQFAREKNIPYLGICLGLQLAVIEFARNVCGVPDATSTEFEKPGTAFIDYLPDQHADIDKGGTLRLGHQEAEVVPGSLIYRLYERAGRVTCIDQGNGDGISSKFKVQSSNQCQSSNDTILKIENLSPFDGKLKIENGKLKDSCDQLANTREHSACIISDRHRHRYEVVPEKQETLRSHGMVLSGTSHDGRLVEYIENPACRYFVATQAHPEFKSRPGHPHPLFDGLVEAAIQKKL